MWSSIDLTNSIRQGELGLGATIAIAGERLIGRAAVKNGAQAGVPVPLKSASVA